jgi:RNase P subunit RPR2
MATKITTCVKCESLNIKELNPDNRNISNSPICTILCECKDCGNQFSIKSWTLYGKRKGILY